MRIEGEPGSGGRELAENTIRNLAGFRVHADKVTGSKRVRAEPFAAQVQAGNVFLVAGDWVNDFRDECEGVAARLPGPGRRRGRRLQQVGVGDVLHQLRHVALTGCFDWPLTASELRHVAESENAAHWLLRLRTSCSTYCRAASKS